RLMPARAVGSVTRFGGAGIVIVTDGSILPTILATGPLEITMRQMGRHGGGGHAQFLRLGRIVGRMVGDRELLSLARYGRGTAEYLSSEDHRQPDETRDNPTLCTHKHLHTKKVPFLYRDPI